MNLDGTVGSSPIYLNGVVFRRAAFHLAGLLVVDGQRADHDRDAGARPERVVSVRRVAGGRIVKLSTANGRPAWSVSITKLPTREKVAGALNFANGNVVAVTGGYLGDAPPYDTPARQLHAREHGAADASDRDLGSTSPVVLDSGHLAQGGKDGRIRVLSVARMRGSAPHRGGALQSVSTPSGADLFTAPAVWRTGSGTWLFAADDGGTTAWRWSGGRLRRVWRHGTGGTRLNVYRPGTGALVATLPAAAGTGTARS